MFIDKKKIRRREHLTCKHIKSLDSWLAAKLGQQLSLNEQCFSFELSLGDSSACTQISVHLGRYHHRMSDK